LRERGAVTYEGGVSRPRLCAVGLLLCSGAALARSGGISAPSCTGCHSGGAAPVANITVTPTSFAPGDTVSVRVAIDGPGAVGGVFLTAHGVGALAPVAGQGTRLSAGEVLHASPKAAVNGRVTFEAQWKAPATPGGVTFDAAVVSANGDQRRTGDSGATATRALVFGCAGTTYFRDFDGDGVGAASSGTALDCSRPDGYAEAAGDCDENDARVRPGAPEVCNGRDDDCDGAVDEDLATVTTWPDADGDGYGASDGAPASGCGGLRRAPNASDCDDREPAVNPGATEVCNGRDDDCDLTVDEGARVRCGEGWCARYGPTCDPAQCTPGPPQAERCNALDDDCDGVVDDGQPCGQGATCVEGRCVDEGDVPDAGSAGGGGGAGGGCASVPAAQVTLLAVLCCGVMRRRRVKTGSGPRRGR
jgi:hypothetical protein